MSDLQPIYENTEVWFNNPFQNDLSLDDVNKEIFSDIMPIDTNQYLYNDTHNIDDIYKHNNFDKIDYETQYIPSYFNNTNNKDKEGTTKIRYTQAKTNTIFINPINPVNKSICKAILPRYGTKCNSQSLNNFYDLTTADYCAQHIHLDKNSLYKKCGFKINNYRICRGITPKDFDLCYKHYFFRVKKMVEENDITACNNDWGKLSSMIESLKDISKQLLNLDKTEYQNKMKILIRFRKMRIQVENALTMLNVDITKT